MSDTEDEEPAVAEDEKATATEDKQQTVWQRLTLSQLRWTAVAIILVVTAAFGGLKTAHHVTPISFGKTYNVGAVQITPHSATLTDQWVGLPSQKQYFDDKPAMCHYLVLHVTVQNTANESVPFPLPGVIAGMPEDCSPRKVDTFGMFELSGIKNRYVAAFRGHEQVSVPSIESGFTNDFSVIWAVPRADLKRHPQISVHFLKMRTYISTFLIAQNWAGDPDHYAELKLPSLELS